MERSGRDRGVDILGEGGLRDLDERDEGRHVVDGQVGQDLAVDLDAGQAEALDEPVVGQAVGPGARVDALDPELAELALLLAAVVVAVDQRVGDLLLGLAVEPRSLTPVAGGALEDDPALLLGVDRPLDACHVVLLLVKSSGAGGQRPRSFFARGASTLETSVVPDIRRVTLEAFFSRLWRSPVFWRRILPDPVTRMRLLAPECVLFFGMSVLSFVSRVAV